MSEALLFSTEEQVPNLHEEQAILALQKREEVHKTVERVGFPDKTYIEMCREIIKVFPHSNSIADRSERFSKSIKQALLKECGGCAACGGGTLGGSRHAPILEVHHLIPREHGGDNTKENGMLFCRNCHGEVHS
ncbi:MAG: HNH endonuclease [Candidatus Pacebacteria bacterium]|nr:HNH endonuclease [Candidatus Paceibacterota bacterium]